MTAETRLAHEVPIALFEKLAAKSEADGGPRRERRPIDGRSDAEVICLGDVWISVERGRMGPAFPPSTNFRLWSREPGRGRDDVFDPSPVFTIYGGPVDDGVWAYGRGSRYRTAVVVNYGYFSKIDLLSSNNRHLMECAAGILSIAMRLSDGVESVAMWDAETAKHAPY